MRKKLEESEIIAALAALPHWKFEQGKLTRALAFEDFKSAIDFVNKVAILAEQANHHPDIDIRYNQVRLSLITHDAGAITQHDIDLSKKIDLELAESF